VQGKTLNDTRKARTSDHATRYGRLGLPRR
jgi:hypothetical protein